MSLLLSALLAVSVAVWVFAAVPFALRPFHLDAPALILAAVISLTGWLLWRTWSARQVPTARCLWLLASWAGLGAQLALIGWLYG